MLVFPPKIIFFDRWNVNMGAAILIGVSFVRILIGYFPMTTQHFLAVTGLLLVIVGSEYDVGSPSIRYKVARKTGIQMAGRLLLLAIFFDFFPINLSIQVLAMVSLWKPLNIKLMFLVDFRLDKVSIIHINL